jgi:hypothetical protein
MLLTGPAKSLSLSPDTRSKSLPRRKRPRSSATACRRPPAPETATFRTWCGAAFSIIYNFRNF